MSDMQLAVLPPEDDTLYPRPVQDESSNGSLYITLAKRIFRQGGKQVINLAAQTAVPLSEDEPHSISDMALSLADGTRVAVSVQLLNNVNAWRPARVHTIYDPQRYEAAEKARRGGILPKLFFLGCVMATGTLMWNYWERGIMRPFHSGAVARTITPAVHTRPGNQAMPSKTPFAKVNRTNNPALETTPTEKPHSAKQRTPHEWSRHSSSPHRARKAATTESFTGFPRLTPARGGGHKSAGFFIPPPPPFMPSQWQMAAPGLSPLSGNSQVIMPDQAPKQSVASPKNADRSAKTKPKLKPPATWPAASSAAAVAVPAAASQAVASPAAASPGAASSAAASSAAAAPKATPKPAQTHTPSTQTAEKTATKQQVVSKQLSKAASARMVQELLPSVVSTGSADTVPKGSFGSQTVAPTSGGNHAEVPHLRLDPLAIPEN